LIGATGTEVCAPFSVHRGVVQTELGRHVTPEIIQQLVRVAAVCLP
jgi:hypothetical protein